MPRLCLAFHATRNDEATYYSCVSSFSLTDNRRLPYNHRQRSFTNGSVMIDVVDKRSDSGEYKCVVKSAHKVASKMTKVIVESKLQMLLPSPLPLFCSIICKSIIYLSSSLFSFNLHFTFTVESIEFTLIDVNYSPTNFK